RSIWDRKVIRNIGCLRGKDCAGEVQIVERTTSIKEAVRGFAENLAFGCRVSSAGGRRKGRQGIWDLSRSMEWYIMKGIL
ncbi:hypothetical protein NXH58_06340, partial [Agathobacter ruminis]|uniref:hypothetical protein n=1 Tax=Agathobacter ruminis TaxID=1712665 RepID=UPI00234C5761